MFAEELQKYRDCGAGALRAQLSSMMEKAMDSRASKDYLYFVADVCMDLKAFQEASRLLSTAAARFGESDVLLNLLAFCAWEQGAEDEAFATYCKSLTHNPDNISSLRGACFLAIEKENPSAPEYCRDFYDRSGETHEAAVWYATALHNSGNKGELKKLVEDWQDEFGPSEELESFLA